MSKQVLDVQQMQHLQELGLDTSKASMHFWIIRNGEYSQEVGGYVFSKEPSYITLKLHPYEFMSDVAISIVEDIPTFTLQDVLDALPARIKHKDFRYYLVYNKSEGFIGYYRVDFDGNNRYARYEEFYNGIDGLSVIDAAYSMLCWCIENKFVETDKNE